MVSRRPIGILGALATCANMVDRTAHLFGNLGAPPPFRPAVGNGVFLGNLGAGFSELFGNLGAIGSAFWGRISCSLVIPDTPSSRRAPVCGNVENRAPMAREKGGSLYHAPNLPTV